MDDAELAEEGQRDQSVGATHRQVARDLLQLAQVSLQLRRYVVWRRGGQGLDTNLKRSPAPRRWDTHGTEYCQIAHNRAYQKLVIDRYIVRPIIAYFSCLAGFLIIFFSGMIYRLTVQ